MLFFYPRYGKRLIFRAMQAMQFIHVFGHTVKNFIALFNKSIDL